MQETQWAAWTEVRHFARRAGVLLVTAQADLGAGPRVELPGVEDRSRLFAADLQVFAGRAVAILAGLVAMDVAFLEGLGVDLVAGAQSSSSWTYSAPGVVGIGALHVS